MHRQMENVYTYREHMIERKEYKSAKTTSYY